MSLGVSLGGSFCLSWGVSLGVSPAVSFHVLLAASFDASLGVLLAVPFYASLGVSLDVPFCVSLGVSWGVYYWVCHVMFYWVCYRMVSLGMCHRLRSWVRHWMCVVQVLQHASPAHLTSLTVALDQLDQRYEYDIEYLNNYIKWKVSVPHRACSLHGCILFTAIS